MLALRTFNMVAPFTTDDIHIPDFSATPEFDIQEFGAVHGTDTDAQTRNQRAIELAISAAHENKGGVVYVGPGRWACGKIHLKSYVNLHIAKDATLVFSGQPKDYLPAVRTSWEGIECYNYSPLIYAFDCQCIAITGEGCLYANMDVWTEWGARPDEHMQALASLYHQMSKHVSVEERQMVFDGANLRPHFIHFNRCRQVLIEDISILNSPFWVIHPFLCKDVLVRKVKIKAHGHNSDGIDPEMTQNMLIEDCVFDQGDDAIALKAGRNQDGWRLGVSSKNIIIRNCHIKRAHHLIAIGSELAAGIENVLIENCQFDSETDYADAGNLLYIKTNERCGGHVHNIFMHDIRAEKLSGAPLVIETDVLYQWRDLVPTYERRLSKISAIHLHQINANQAQHICRIEEQKELPVSEINLSEITIAELIGEPSAGNHQVIISD